jgi:hypothetical protein
LKLFEIQFTYTPDDDTSGEGVITAEGESLEAVKELIHDFLGDLPDLVVTEIREIVEIPEYTQFTPRTLN